jgi:hypothetical protein
VVNRHGASTFTEESIMPATENLRFGAARGVPDKPVCHDKRSAHDISAQRRIVPRAATLGLTLAFMSLAILFLSASASLAQDFRIDTEVFIGKEKSPRPKR